MNFIQNLKSKLFSKEDYASLTVTSTEFCEENNSTTGENQERSISSSKKTQGILEKFEKVEMVIMRIYSWLAFFLFGVIIIVVLFGFEWDEFNVFSKNTQEVPVLTEQDSELYNEFEHIDIEDGEKHLPFRELKPIDEDSVYYGKTYKDLYIDYESDDYAVQLLHSISYVNYGTAGSGLDMDIDGYRFLLLSQLSEDQWSEIPAFLDSLTPEQIDFLSYRVVDTYNRAVEIIAREGIIINLDSVYIDPETYQDCSEVQAVKFLTYMMNLFNERNVNYEWGEYYVLGIFY